MGHGRITGYTRLPRARRAGWASVLVGLLGLSAGGALTVINTAGASQQPGLRATAVECSSTITYAVTAPDGDDAARTNTSVGVWAQAGDVTGFVPTPDQVPAVDALTVDNGFAFTGTIETGAAPGSVVTVRAAALGAWGDGASPGDAEYATVTIPPSCDVAPTLETTAPPVEDTPPAPPAPLADDGDGVATEIEQAAPNGGDGNGDGIADASQANVASLPSRYDVDGNGALDDFVTIVAPTDTALANVRALEIPADNPPPDGATLPAGLFDYDLDVGTEGAAADVRVILPEGEQRAVYMLQGGKWRAFDAHASIDDAADEVTLHLVDGGAGDRSGADGVINDPFGVGAPGDVGSITFTKVAAGGASTSFSIELARCVGAGSPPGTDNTASSACSSVDSIETSTVLGGGSKTSSNLNTDSHWYRLRETPATAGWTLSTRSCTGGQASTTTGAPSDGIFVRLNAGAGAVCTFTNATNSITARKGGIRIPGQNTANTFVAGVDGATFEYATNTTFTSGLADLCTTASVPGPTGTCAATAISNGTKYVREKTSPSGWEKITEVAYGGGPNGPNPNQPYVAATPNLTGGTAATTRWFVNRMTNPSLSVDTCGLKIGLLLDKSQSISGFQNDYIAAAQGFVSQLSNTPTQMKLYSFGINAQSYNGGNFYNLASGGDVTSANTQISNIYNSLEAGTNWDAGLQQVGNAGLDVLFVITDGNPIMWQGNTSGSTVDLEDVEAGVASANLVKSFGQRVVSIGVGDLTATNIALLSGPQQGSDYFTGSVAALHQTLKDLAKSLCGGSVTVKKQVRTGPGANDFANAPGWQMSTSPAAATVTPADGLTDANGTVNFDYSAGPWPKEVTVTEAQQAGYSLVQQSGNNAACTIDGSAASVQNTGSAQAPGVKLTIDANDIVACTFRNAPTTSQIQVVKTTAGGAAGPFSFTVTGGPNGTNAPRTATTVSANTPTNAQGPVQDLYPGSYTITESSLPAGWDLADIVCSGATDNGTANLLDKKIVIGVGAAQSVTCTFTNNSQAGEIVVVKKAIGGEETFPFTLSQGGNPVPGQGPLNITAGPATPADDGQDGWADVDAGTYAVAETLPAGWELTSSSCDDGSPLNAVQLDAGETVTCTVTNTKRAKVTIVKHTVGLGAGADFSFSVPVAFGAPGNTVTLSPPDGGGDDSESFSVAAGTYPVTEQGPPNGWDLTNLTCDDGSATAGPTATIDVEAGEDVTCTWTNTKRADVTIEKIALGDDAATFDFSVPGAFDEPDDTLSLSTPEGGGSASESYSVQPGSYAVAEDDPLPDSWDFTSLTCTNGDVADGQGVTIEVAAGELVTCTWTNTQRPANGNVVITKIGDGLGAGATFDFSVPTAFEPGGALELTTPAGGGSDTQGYSVTPNTDTGYVVSELVPLPEGWDFSDLECTNPDGEQPSTIDDQTATIFVSSGETVTCTWTNTKRGEVTIEKVAEGLGAGADFDFSVPASFGAPGSTLTLSTPTGGGDDAETFSVKPGTYDVGEDTPLPEGWDFSDLSCTNASTPDGPSVSIDVAAGEQVTCTWTNTKRADVTIVKVGVGDGGGATFDFSVPSAFDEPDDTLSLTTPTDGGSDSQAYSVAPGSYSVSEDAPLPDGWAFTSLSCTNDAEPEGQAVDIDVAAGEQVTCTWTNTKLPGTITIAKTAIGESAEEFDFSVPAAFGAPDDTVSIATPAGGGTVESTAFEVPEGTYPVSETGPPAGWDLTDIECTNGSEIVSPTANIEVAAGGDVTCTWTNTERADVTIEKVAIGSGPGATFDFSVPGAFGAPDDVVSLQTPAGGGADSESFSVPPGTYEVTEQGPPAGWVLSGISCTNDAQPAGQGVDIEVAAGESVTCTWTNTVTTARVEVVKQVAGNDVADWTFDGLVEGGTAHFVGGGTTASRTTAGVPPVGVFDLEQVPSNGAAVNLAEQLKVGYAFAGATCAVIPEQGDAQPIESNASDATATPTVFPGQVVRCTFVNNFLPASILLTKTGASSVTAGSDTSFSVLVTNNGEVPLTNAVVTDALPAGVTFVSATVVDGNPGTCSQAAGIVTCTLDGTLEIDETSTISLVVNVPANTTVVSITNVADVTADPPACAPVDTVSDQVGALASDCPVTSTDDATVPVITVGGETVDVPRVLSGTLPFTGPAGLAALKSAAWLLAIGGALSVTHRRRRTV